MYVQFSNRNAIFYSVYPCNGDLTINMYSYAPLFLFIITLSHVCGCFHEQILTFKYKEKTFILKLRRCENIPTSGRNFFNESTKFGGNLKRSSLCLCTGFHCVLFVHSVIYNIYLNTYHFTIIHTGNASCCWIFYKSVPRRFNYVRTKSSFWIVLSNTSAEFRGTKLQLHF